MEKHRSAGRRLLQRASIVLILSMVAGLLLAVVSPAQPASAAAAYVRSAQNSGGGPATSFSATLTATTATDAIIAFVKWESATTDTMTCTDARGSTYTTVMVKHFTDTFG